MSGFLLHNLLHFGRLLKGLGLDVPPGRMIEASRALDHVSLGHRHDVRLALRTLLVRRREDLDLFDRAFALFWRPPTAGGGRRDLQPMRPPPKRPPPRVDVPTAESPDDVAGPPARPLEPAERVAASSASDREVWRTTNFAAMTEVEMAEARRVIARLRWDFGLRRTRRWQAGRGPAIDLRRASRRNLRYGGELLVLPAKRRTVTRRPLVIIADVSGSMERYARMLLAFALSVTGSIGRVETFLFATRLTRVTRQLTRPRAAESISDLPSRAPDWGAGTRIGEALRRFNVQWGRRVLEHGSMVLLISDGWDRGEPAVLRQEMARLQRSCHRLIWLNPLLGSPDYQPLTRGMRAALPFVDDFLPVHNLVSLERLAAHLDQLD